MDQIEQIADTIAQSPKYQEVARQTILELVRIEIERHKRPRDVEKAVRKRLHQIMAFYLGDADYSPDLDRLRAAFAVDNPDTVREVCCDILSVHPSTRERLLLLPDFYDRIFAITGQPSVLLDLACALNPLTYPWMGLPASLHYYAYDIHQTRIDFLNTYFTMQGLAALARLQDIAFTPPAEAGDLALFLKELPRFDRHYGGAIDLLRTLRVKWLVVSFPTTSLHGGRSLIEQYREYFVGLIADEGWLWQEIKFENELVFCVEKDR